MVNHPNERHKGQVVPICFVGTIKYNDITKCCIIKHTLSITPEHSLHVSFPISHVLEEELRISVLTFLQVTDDYLSITIGNYLMLIEMAEIIQVP